MKIQYSIIAFLAVWCFFAGRAECIEAEEILERVDATFSSPIDQTLHMKLIIIDAGGNQKEREIVMYQKGADRRLGKFLTPADQKGIAFLSLPDDVMYLYLPAYKKTRRIASHVKNTKFAGTDFTYEDMEAQQYAEKWNAQLVEEDSTYYVLKMDPKEHIFSEYSMLKMWVDSRTFIVTKIEYYDQTGILIKVMQQEDFEKVKGHWIARKSEMRDIASDHRTRMLIEEVKFDTGLADDIFTQRYLER
jgi:outer membrane lipoprotein-sorting protein